MKKSLGLLTVLALAMSLVAPGSATAAGLGGPGKPEKIAVAAKDLIRLLPRTTIAVYVIDLRRLLEVDAVVKLMWDLKVLDAWNEFVKTSGVDPKMDVAYVGFGMPGPEDPSRFVAPATDVPLENFGIVINLKYDRARILGFIKQRDPEPKSAVYNGVPVLSIGPVDKASLAWTTTPGGIENATGALAGVGKFELVAFLDASHIVIGDDKGVKGIIDVFRKKTESLAKNPEMTGLVNRIDKPGLAWFAVAFPPGYFKNLADINPSLRPFETVKGMTLSVDDKSSSLVAAIRTFGGTKDQNANLASILIGFKVIGTAALAAKEPALGELLNGVVISSGDDFTRLTASLPHETIGKLLQLVQPKAGFTLPDPLGARKEWTTLNNEAMDLHDKGETARAVEVGKRAVELAEKSVGPDHPDVAISLNNLAVFYDALGRHAEAEPFFQRALAIREKVFGPDHPDVVATLYNFGRHYAVQGRHADAEPFFQRALVIREKALGPDHPDVAVILDEFGYLRHGQGRDADAVPFFQRALVIREKALGPDHSEVGKSLENLANLDFFQGRYTDAEPLYKRSLAIWEKALGPNHPNVAQTLNLLGNVYFVQGQPAKAESLLKRSLAITEKNSGPDHPDVANPLLTLAMIYFSQRKFAKAEPLLERSLAVREKTDGPDAPVVAQTLDALAQLYRETRREKKAEELEARAARIRTIKR